jgi:hypothetical protein
MQSTISNKYECHIEVGTRRITTVLQLSSAVFMAVTLRLPLLSPHLPPRPLSDQSPNPNGQPPLHKWPRCSYSRRDGVILTSIVLPAISLAPPRSSPATDSPEKANASTRKPFLDGIVNTKSWFQYIGDGFSIRAPPQFDDVIEPEASVLFTPWINLFDCMNLYQNEWIVYVCNGSMPVCIWFLPQFCNEAYSWCSVCNPSFFWRLVV